MTGHAARRSKKFQKTNSTTKREVVGDGHASNQFENSPIVKAFEGYAAELNYKHDKYERIVKLSRDVTIHSKRIIYAIHGLMRSNNVSKDIEEIKESLKTVRETMLLSIAKELLNDDYYQFYRAYTWGIQEYIESVTFLHYVINGSLFGFKETANSLKFQIPTANDDVPAESGDSVGVEGTDSIQLFITETDYMLGLQDLTGELMRHCINSFAALLTADGKRSCDFVRALYSAMLLLPYDYDKEFSKKVNVARMSLEKMEMACYSKHVRGSEAQPYQENMDDVYSLF